jgi:hypothetical protein
VIASFIMKARADVSRFSPPNCVATDAIVEAASENPDKRILVDLAAQTHDSLVK